MIKGNRLLAKVMAAYGLLLMLLGMLVCPSLAQVRRAPLPLPNMQPNQPPLPAVVRVRLEGGLITAQVIATPMQQVLDELASRTGVIFEVQSQDNPIVSISLYRVPLEEAIARLAGGSNRILYYGKDAAGQNRIEMVRIFPRANVPQQPSLRYIGTGVVTKTGDETVETPEQALKVLTESGSLEARQKAVEVLAAAKGDFAIQVLTQILQDSAPEIRVAAIEGLAGLGARSSLPQILQALKDSHPGVRQSAVTAVALLGDADNVKNLKPLSKDPDLSVAAAAEMAIQKLGSRRP